MMRETMTLMLQKARAFLGARRGNVAMMFAISLVPITIAAGVGLDFARAAMVRSAMSEALDAAALAVGSTTGLTHDAAQTLAQKYFAANYTGDAIYGTPTVSIAATGYNSAGSVTITATDNMPATLLKIAGYSTVPVSTSTTVVWGQSKLWVALVLDNSGSMSQSDRTGSKMDALKNASGQLLTILQNASSNAGDVQVAIVPFVNVVNIGTGYVSKSWIDWTDWAAPPPNVTLSTSLGPGGDCPFTGTDYRGRATEQSPYGFGCTSGSANGSSGVNSIPASGLICPGIDSGDYNTAHRDRYYNGCWTSTPTTTTSSSSTTSNGNTTTSNLCTNSSSCTTASYCGGYPNSSTSSSTSGNTVTVTVTTNTCACNTTSGTKKTCVKTTKPVSTATTTTTTTGLPYTHTWTANDHSTWSGCIMDRTQDYDIKNTTPTSTGTNFPATNPQTCPGATVTTLGYNWTNLTSQIQNMQPNGSTNQAIGMAHGWQMLTPGDPYGAPAVPANTSRYIILLSDGLNTQDRWWGDGSTEGTTDDQSIDSREKKTCDAAKADGITIYSIYLNIGGDADSAPLSYCATDSTKYFELTSTSAVVSTFNQIAQQITNVRVSK